MPTRQRATLLPLDVTTGQLPKLAIATIAMYGLSGGGTGCTDHRVAGMLGWCQSAKKLATQLKGIAEVSTLILTDQQVLADCPHAETVAPSASLLTLARKWCQKHGSDFDPMSSLGGLSDVELETRHDDFTEATLMKLQLLNTTVYDVMLFTDGDVDVAPPDADDVRVRKLWSERLTGFLSDKSALVIGTPDFSAPINAGVWLTKPSPKVFDTMRGVLERNVWSVAKGFDNVGVPQSMLASVNKTCGDDHEQIARSQFMTFNNWHFVGGGIDQGLLFYLYHHLLDGAYRVTNNTDLQFLHWWAHPKPWESEDDSFLGARVAYFDALDLERSADVDDSKSCRGYLSELRSKARAAAGKGSNAENPHAQPYFTASRAAALQLAHAAAEVAELPVTSWRSPF